MSKSGLATISVPAYEGNFTYGRSGRNIEAITIHHMAGKLTAEQCGRIFQQVGRYGSSHYGIGYNGEIASYVDEENTAWTNSNWDSNCKSVTIETSNSEIGGSWPVSDASLNALIKLVADIAKRNGLGTLVPGQNLTWHSMFADTTCPGDYLRSKMQYIADEANKLNAPAPEPTPSKSVDELAQEVIAGLWGNQPERQQRLEAAGYDYYAVQARVNEILAPAPAPKPSKSVDDLAREVIRGDWGNGQERKDRLTAAGYDYSTVQARVNEMLSGNKPAPKPVDNTVTYTVKPGDTLWGIAERFLGKGSRWREIYYANQAIIGANPNIIYPGQKLTIKK